MEDVVTSKPKAHEGPAADALPVEGALVLDPCRGLQPANLADHLSRLNDPAALLRHASVGAPRARLYVAVDPDSGFYAEVIAAGPIEAIELPAVQGAPIGALLIVDARTDDRGQLVAERALHGWVLVLGDGGRRA